MLSLPPSTLTFLARDRVDGRKGIDSLVSMVRSQFRTDPLSGHLFVFLTRRGNGVRVIYWDRNGYVLTLKRLERSTFKPPIIQQTHAIIEADDRVCMLGGIDLSRTSRRPRWTPSVASK